MSAPDIHARLFVGRARALLLVLMMSASGCSASPSQNILGSYFPSWMLCLGLGVVAAALCRLLLVLVGLNDVIPLQLVSYLAVALAVTFLIWLLFFGQ